MEGGGEGRQTVNLKLYIKTKYKHNLNTSSNPFPVNKGDFSKCNGDTTPLKKTVECATWSCGLVPTY